MTFTPQIHKAVKHTVKLKIGIQGPSGSGKTMGALALATQLVPGGKVLLVDTEHESASLYADRYDFDTIPLTPPFLSANYEACIDAAVKGGYDVLVIDSITHQWDGEGGILRRKEAVDERGGNSFTNWKPFTAEHNQFKEKIIQAPIHIIATMRSKTEYIMEQNDKGKQMPKKVGTAPIQRDGMEYEFSIVFDVQMDHRGKPSKDRTGGIFGANLVNLCDPSTAELLRNWMNSGEPAIPVVPSAAPTPQTQAATAPVERQQPAAAPASSGEHRTPNKSTKPITEPQQKRLFAIAKGQNASVEDVKKVVKLCGYEHSAEIKMCDYEAICELFTSGRWADKLEESATQMPPKESTTITDADLPF